MKEIVFIFQMLMVLVRKELAKKYFIEEQTNLIEMLSKFVQPNVFLLSSTDGEQVVQLLLY